MFVCYFCSVIISCKHSLLECFFFFFSLPSCYCPLTLWADCVLLFSVRGATGGLMMSPIPSLCVTFVRPRDPYVGSRCEKSVSTVRCVDTDPPCLCRSAVSPSFPPFCMSLPVLLLWSRCYSLSVMFFCYLFGASWRPLAVGSGSSATSQSPLAPATKKQK